MTAALTYLFAAVPVLNAPVLRNVIEWAARFFTDLLYEVADLAFDLTVIVIRNENLRREYDKSSVALKIIRQNYGADSVRYKEARDESRKALAAFVRIRVDAD